MICLLVLASRTEIAKVVEFRQIMQATSRMSNEVSIWRIAHICSCIVVRRLMWRASEGSLFAIKLYFLFCRTAWAQRMSSWSPSLPRMPAWGSRSVKKTRNWPPLVSWFKRSPRSLRSHHLASNCTSKLKRHRLSLEPSGNHKHRPTPPFLYQLRRGKLNTYLRCLFHPDLRFCVILGCILKIVLNPILIHWVFIVSWSIFKDFLDKGCYDRAARQFAIQRRCFSIGDRVSIGLTRKTLIFIPGLGSK